MTRRTQAQWQTIIEQHVQSGLSPREYCSQHNIHLQTFYSRRHAMGLANTRKYKRKTTPTKSVSQFVQANVVSRHCSIVMQTREAQLSFSSECDPAWLAKLLKELAA
jgi:hypothetical protein